MKGDCGRCSIKVKDPGSTDDAEDFKTKSLGLFATPAHKNSPSAASGMSSDYSASPQNRRPSRPTTADELTPDQTPKSRATNQTKKRMGNMPIEMGR